MALKLKVKQIRSGRDKAQRTTLKGIGLTRMNQSVLVNDTQAIRGMIRKVSHLVEIQPAE
jgi:large subunit ribosomal protein L30